MKREREGEKGRKRGEVEGRKGGEGKEKGGRKRGKRKGREREGNERKEREGRRMKDRGSERHGKLEVKLKLKYSIYQKSAVIPHAKNKMKLFGEMKGGEPRRASGDVGENTLHID